MEVSNEQFSFDNHRKSKDEKDCIAGNDLADAI